MTFVSYETRKFRKTFTKRTFNIIIKPSFWIYRTLHQIIKSSNAVLIKKFIVFQGLKDMIKQVDEDQDNKINFKEVLFCFQFNSKFF